MSPEARDRNMLERILMLEYRDAIRRLLDAERGTGREDLPMAQASVSRLEEALDRVQSWEPNP